MHEESSLDAHSLKILVELQRDARKTVQQLSEAVGLSPTPCWKRIKDMEDAGVITGYTALVDRERLGLLLSVLVEDASSPFFVAARVTHVRSSIVLKEIKSEVALPIDWIASNSSGVAKPKVRRGKTAARR